MKQKLVLFTLAWMLSVLTAWSQTRIISGVVTDGKDPLIGATIVIKGSAGGASSDAEGKFSISIPEAGGTLVVRYLGMLVKEINLDATSSNISVVMEKDPLMLDEVRVTAIGEKRSMRKIGYSTSQIQGKAIASSGESGAIQGMSGKVSNLAITKNTGDPGAGAFIQIRGQSTITGNLQPLIVVDGVPVSNSSIGGTIDGVVQQSRLNDLNPEDIASVEVLKGAAASAVWGTRASNGVIIVTTKKGKRSNKSNNMNVEISSSLGLDYVNREYTKQSTYGQGSAGKWVANAGGSWGDKIANRSGADTLNLAGAKFVAEDGSVYNTITKKGSKSVYNDANRDQVFRTGVTMNNNISISSGNEKSSIYFNVADWNQQGVLNGTSDYRRTSGRLNYSHNLNDKVKVSLNSVLSKVFSNRIQQGSNLDGLYLGYLRTSPDFDNTDYLGTYYTAGGVPTFNSHRGYRRYLGNSAPSYNNPGWTLNKQTNTSDVTRIILTPEVAWEWADKSILTVRTGYDISNDRRITYFPVLSAGSYANGGFTDDMIKQSELSFHAYNKNSFDVNSDISLNTTVGFLYTDRNFYNIGASASQFILRNQDRFAFINSTAENKAPFNSIENLENNRVYAIVDLDYQDKVFLQLTAASEAASTFKSRFTYPSATLAYEFTKDILKSDILSYGKLRASYGVVGVEPPAYIWSTNYVNSVATSGWGETLEGSQFGGSIYRSSTRGNPDIKPEQKTEYEIGTDLKLLNNKIGLSATYYSNKTTAAILAVDVPASTGYTSKWDNAATITNTGFEAELNLKVIDNSKLIVNIFGNIGINRNMVDELTGDVKSIFLAGFTGTSSRAVKGYAMGTLWGGKWEKDAAGNQKLDANGFPMAAAEEGVLGDPNAKYRAGLGANASWNGLDVNILFETSQVGKMWGGTAGVLDYFGISPETANEVTLTAAQAATVKDYNGQTVDQIATANADGSYTVRGNLKNFGAGDVLLDQTWYQGLGGGFGAVAEDFVKDASWFRLRELSVNYKIPASILQKLKIPGASIGFTGRNLALWTDFVGVDPELNLTGTSNGRGLDYFTNPGTKSYIFSLKLNF